MPCIMDKLLTHDLTKKDTEHCSLSLFLICGSWSNSKTFGYCILSLDTDPWIELASNLWQNPV